MYSLRLLSELAADRLSELTSDRLAARAWERLSREPRTVFSTRAGDRLREPRTAFRDELGTARSGRLRFSVSLCRWLDSSDRVESSEGA